MHPDKEVRPVAVSADLKSEGDLLVEAIQDAGFSCMRVRSLAPWSDANPFGVAVLKVDSASNFNLVRCIKQEHPGVSPICLIARPSTEDAVAAFAVGAEGVLDVNTPAQRVVEAVRAASQGMMLIDTALVRNLVTHVPRSFPKWLPTADLTLLRLIVEGATPHTIAKELHCSRRTAYRRMQDLYDKIGVRDRNEAIYLAGRWALLEEPPP